jgi:hypothetical protein
LVALAAIVGGVIVSSVTSSSPPTTRSFGTQAGYVWQGQVRSVGASWTVPHIIGTSPCGVAGTWIGAVAPGTPGPFIQIGVNETCTQAGPDGKPAVFYEAFWSDVRLHFHPRRLFFVNAGDVISASLTLADHRWTLVLVDRSSGETTHFSTRRVQLGGVEAGGRRPTRRQTLPLPAAEPHPVPLAPRRLSRTV